MAGGGAVYSGTGGGFGWWHFAEQACPQSCIYGTDFWDTGPHLVKHNGRRIKGPSARCCLGIENTAASRARREGQTGVPDAFVTTATRRTMSSSQAQCAYHCSWPDVDLTCNEKGGLLTCFIPQGFSQLGHAPKWQGWAGRPSACEQVRGTGQACRHMQ